ncbi:vWA domain-containing protein [Macrococcoides caseolyticum]|uniref:vWA domain-containing protein n=1 Tax=Macrococcoides caseolyticum TaxID=69966 RepID=UPI001F200856|nr:VWA domain-containing protein [Macrococcus caseolyticus]MCE4957005.1 VWA domain-containing protein [Macrococcus caseolyticus]
MSEKFILFNDERVDPSLLMTLTDLAQLLREDENVKVNFQKFAYFDLVENTINVAFKWKHREKDEEMKLLKSDTILHAIGFNNLDLEVVDSVLSEDFRVKSFFQQLFMMIEEFRLIMHISKTRPLTHKFFKVRKEAKLKENESQIKFYQTKAMPTDELFLQIEHVLLTDNLLEFHSMFFDHLEYDIQLALQSIYHLQNTEDSVNLAIRLMLVIEPHLTKDMLNEYYYIPKLAYMNALAYKKANLDKAKQDVSNMDESEAVQSKHRDTETKSGAYLETEVNEGSNSNNIKENDREGDASDDITEMLMGKGKKKAAQIDAEGNDISDLVGEENTATQLIWKKTEQTEESLITYQQYKEEVLKEIKTLVNVINKSVDHEVTAKRQGLSKGKLSRNLTDWFIDDRKRVFYKEDQKSYQLDATFMLLVDASYSMEDKLEETKKGIVLFHETLLQLAIRHEIMAFSEDGFEADKYMQPNILEQIITYQDSLQNQYSPNVVSYNTGEDNRDGLAIRVAGNMLKKRTEKQKFLIVFSDGEPSAFDYESNGIIDTHDAVVQLRKDNIFVINIFLSQTRIDENTMATIKNIYNDYCIFVEGVEKLPSVIQPLLKTLLLQSMKQF